MQHSSHGPPHGLSYGVQHALSSALRRASAPVPRRPSTSADPPALKSRVRVKPEPMPPASISYDSGYHIQIAVDARFNLEEPTLEVRHPLDKLPLAGAWELEIERFGDDDIYFSVQCVTTTPSMYADDIDVDIRLEWHDGQEFRQFWSRSDSFDSGLMRCMFEKEMNELREAAIGGPNLTTQRKYRIVVEIRRDSRRSSPQAQVHARRLPDLNLKANPHDVRLFFPETPSRAAAELWTSEHLLRTSSPYYDALFNSGLAETVVVGSKRARTDDDESPAASSSVRPVTVSPVADSPDKTFEDSDDETDAFSFKQQSVALDDALESGEFPHKQVTITQAAFSTYRAVLLWLSTGYIGFAQPSSAYASKSSTSPSRNDTLLLAHQSNPRHPFLVSPKSVYRLAHVLELTDLESLAVRYFRDEALTLKNAPVELFSELSSDHAPWRDMVVEWVVERWYAVERSKAWQAMMDRFESEEIEGVGPIWVALTRKLAERRRV